MTTDRDANISGALTGSQLKALLMVALKGARPAAPASESVDPQIAWAQTALDELAAASGEPVAGIFARIERHGLDVAELREAKDVAKRLLSQASTRPQKDAVTLLYHLTVAAAFVCHGEQISTRPQDVRQSIYKDLAEMLSGPIAEIFRQAAG